MILQSLDEARFWVKVKKTIDGCWMWTGRVNAAGYGQFWLSSLGRPTGSHRVAWMIQRGEIPRGRAVLHSCDNPSCVRGSHLFTGTLRDNIRDMMSKGRQLKGERVHTAKLRASHVRRIRYRLLRGRRGTAAQLAREYGVTKRCIYAIRDRESWKHI